MKKIILNVVVLVMLSAAPFGAYAAVALSETHTDVSCFGGSNGTIDITPAGTAPFVYLWNDSILIEDRTNLAPGTYTVTVIDALLTSDTLSITIGQPTAISTTKTITHIDCGGGNTGAIDITATGGTPGYTYAWSDFVYTEDRSNLTAANYYFTVTDSRGCTKVDSANVTQPPGMVTSKTVTNVTCGSGANGAIDLTVQFGIPGYTYLWNDGIITQDRTGIAAGTYSVTITDASSCTVSASATVGQSGSGMAINTTSANPSCNGGTNGTITVTNVIGSVGPYSFHWSDGPTTQNRTGLAAGSYTVTATSTTGCTAAATVNLTQPQPLAITLTPIQLSCFGSNNGAINTSVSGGTTSYSYNWGGGVFTQNRLGLATGTYSVTVTDFKGCTATQSAFVPQPLQLTVAATPSPQACIGGPTGSVTTTVAGGTTPYSYWWGSGIVSPDRLNVNAGTYTVTVTDGNGCSAVASGTVLGYTPMVLTTTQVNNACYGNSTGSIDLSVANGWSPFTYTWSSSDTTQDISNLSAGSYTVTVNDNHACSATKTVNITQPSFPITINSTVSDVSCGGANNGSITVSVLNGVAPYTYNWGGGIVTQNRTGLGGGSYTVTVTDNSGCSATAAFTVSEPAAVVISSTVTNVACFGGTTGNIDLTVTGGFAPYTYSWNGGQNTQTRPNLSQGAYAVTVTDNHACSATAAYTITQPTAITVTPTTTNVSCNGANTGAINIAVSGGISPYTFNWGGGVVSQNRSSLAAGSYTVTVTDNTACTVASTSVITQPAAISITSANTNITCNGANDGSITTTVTGGISPYTYSWAGGATTPNRSGLAAGTYVLTVSDNNTCSATFSATITQPSAIVLSTSVTNADCYGATTGGIALSVSGGAGSYTYNWSNGPTTQNNNNIVSGNYSVTVRDANACSATAAATVSGNSQIVTSAVATNITCNGANNGSIDLTVSGGAGGYTYLWSNSSTNEDINALSVATYTVTVKDAVNCSATVSSVVSAPAVLTVSATAVNVACNGGNTGSVNLAVSGGTPAYSYHWSNNASTQNISGLAAQSYAVTVTDANSCTATAAAVVSQPTALSASETHTNLTCNGVNTGTITISAAGGASPYNYNWGNGVTTPSRTALAAGIYTVTVADNNACTATQTVTLTQPTAITLSTTKTDAQCNGAATGSIDLSVSGGTGNYGYHWSNGAVSQDLSGVNANTYTVTVNDANACTAITSATIIQPSPITVSFTLANASCYGGNNGSINTTITGGNGGYVYNWSNGGTTPGVYNLTAGNYNLQITDTTSCVANLSFTVAQPSQIVLSETHNNISCNGANNGSIDLSATGGAGVYTYQWSNNATTQDLSSLTGGQYRVTVTDAGTCSATLGPVSIVQPAAIALSTTASDVVCSGPGTGAVDLTVVGGSAPFVYHWSNNAATEDITAVSAGNYRVTVTDANSCTATIAATVNQSTGMQVSLAKTDITCFGANNGSITTTINGGGGSYTYNWSNTATTANVSNLAAATYSVTVHDAQNCTGVATATIVEPAQINIAETHTNVSCNGSANGSINTTVSGGAGGYNYTWSNGSNGANLNSISAGNYNLTVADAASCTASVSISIAQPAALSLSETHKPYACVSNAGQIDLTVTGGTGPYSYQWTGGLTTEDISNLSAGNYQVNVTDVNGCAATTSVAIAQLAPLSTSIAKTDVTCYGGNNGTLTLTVSGGTAPYQYTWNQGTSTASASNLPAAHYRILVVDSNNCRISDSATIIQPAAIQVSTNVQDISCNGLNDGSISVQVSGGAGGYIYHWNTGDTARNLSNLIKGNYLLTVTDSRNCSVSGINVPITEPQTLHIASAITGIACAGHNDGQIALQVSGGVVPYAFKWNNNMQVPGLAGLAAGSYDVTVTDSHGCEANGAYIIGSVPELVVTPAVHNTPCANVHKGAIELAVTGGNPGYSFNWNNGDNTKDVTGLAAGTYTVTITDARHCTSQSTVSIGADYALEVTASASASQIDLGETVQLSAVATTDNQNTYAWTAANSVDCSTCISTEASPMASTDYIITVIDANGCKATDKLSITVNEVTDIFVPNAFSPNGDGNNDEFKLFGDLGTIAYLDMMVFNRWGEKVFETNNHHFTWDGSYKGETVPQGVFVYTGKVVFINGTSRQLKGSLTVIR